MPPNDSNSARYPGLALTPAFYDAARERTEWDELQVGLVTDPWRLQFHNPLLVLSAQLTTGNLLNSDDSGQPMAAAAIAAQLLDASVISPPNLLVILTWSPFWLEQLSPYGDEPFMNSLVRYRLADACLMALAELSAEQPVAPHLSDSRILLIRQRFRYLAALAEADIYRRKIRGYLSQLRTARETYARLLLEQRSEVELALARAEPPHTDHWPLDEEVMLLITNPATRRAWPVTRQTPLDMALTHRLIRQGLLPTNNLSAATGSIANLLVRPEADGRQSPQGWRQTVSGWWRSAVAFGLHYFHLWLCLGTFISAVVLLFYWHRPNLFIAVATIALLPPLISWLASLILLRGESLALYPLALRIPGMALLGVIGITGLSDTYTVFALNAWQTPVVAWLVTIFCLLLAFAYVYFQSITRTRDWRQALGRSLKLWSYALAVAFWISLLFAALADPLGFTACGPAQPHCIDGLLPLARAMPLWGQRLSIDFTFFFTGLSLLIGVLTQLFWEDKAVAEPI